ncbi:MAG: aspartate racemase [Nocardioidaceae bacterium]|jgi:aspartate racemase|nr:aspartate racemase [Nocardioidaceae bacterium]
MQTIGLIGGMSWHSTVEYYRLVNELVAERRGGHASAKIALQSLDFAEVRACQEADDWDGAARLLIEAAQHCELAGADLVLLCSNLMHRVADDVQDAIDVPLLHIGDAIADRALALGWSRVGLLGTRWVMEEDFYVGRLARHGLTVEVPGPEDRAETDRVIFDELTRGIVRDESRASYAAILARLRDQGAEAVVLGCTEIELLVRPEDAPLPVLASMRTHAEAAVAAALGEHVEA